MYVGTALASNISGITQLVCKVMLALNPVCFWCLYNHIHIIVITLIPIPIQCARNDSPYSFHSLRRAQSDVKVLREAMARLKVHPIDCVYECVNIRVVSIGGDNCTPPLAVDG